MSKNKGKDKKNDATSLIQKQFEAQKRDIIDYQFTVKKLEQRLAQKLLQNQNLTRQLQQVHLVDKQKITLLNERIEDDEKRLTSQINKITQLQINVTRYESLIKSLSEQLLIEKQGRQKQATTLRIKIENDKAFYMKKIEQLKGVDKEKNQQQILELKDQLQYERAQKIRELADKQREKVQATDKLRDKMQQQNNQTKKNLLSLKKQQLSATTRLTILQNHQLTSQLEYQSKQTQKLIFKQEQMQQKIKNLTQQLAIHKQVEQQLAKRAHFSKGIIKKLNQRVSQLQKQIETSKNSRALESVKNLSANQTSGFKSKIYIEAADEGNNKQLLAQVQRQLSNTEKKYSEAQIKLQAVQKQREGLSNQIKRYQISCNQLVKILITYSEQILTKKTCQIDKIQPQLVEPVLRIDLQQLRSKSCQQWSQQQISLVVKILLNLIKPYLSKKNILIPAIRRLLVVQDSKLDKLDKSQPKLPKIQEQDENAMKLFKDLPTNIASKIVGSNLRDWGNTVTLTQNAMIKRKYKLSQSHR